MNRTQSLLRAGIGLMAAVALGAGAALATPVCAQGKPVTTSLYVGVFIQPQPLPPGDRAA